MKPLLKYVLVLSLVTAGAGATAQTVISTNRNFSTYLRVAKLSNGSFVLQIDSTGTGQFRTVANLGYVNMVESNAQSKIGAKIDMSQASTMVRDSAAKWNIPVKLFELGNRLRFWPRRDTTQFDTLNVWGLTPADVNLDLVNNTSDEEKPASNPTKALLNEKADRNNTVLTGISSVETPPLGDASNRIANTFFIDRAVQNMTPPANMLVWEVATTFANISSSTKKRWIEVTTDETNGNVYTLYYHTGTNLRRVATTAVALPTPSATGDTIAVNLSSTTTATKIAWSNWNNIVATNGANYQKENLIYKTSGIASSVDVDSLFNSAVTASSTSCTDTSLAPNVVLAYSSTAVGRDRPGTEEDGTVFYLGGMNPAKTYDFVYLIGSQYSTVRTLSTVGQTPVQSFTVTPTAGCNNFIKLTNLVPDGNGKLRVRLFGSSITASSSTAGFYIIEH